MGLVFLEICHVGETVGNNRRRSQPPFMKDFLKGMFQQLYLLEAGPLKAGISKNILWISFCTSYGKKLRDTAKKTLRKHQEAEAGPSKAKRPTRSKKKKWTPWMSAKREDNFSAQR